MKRAYGGRFSGFLALLGGLLLAVPTLPAAADGDTWTRFRGPNGSGISPSALPSELDPEHAIEWSTLVPFGRSSPAVGRDHVFLTAEENGELATIAVDRDSGEIVWRRALSKLHHAELYHDNDSATPSPVTDGSNVYVFFHEAGLVSYDPSGAERWHLELGPFRNFYGIAASPVLSDDLLILVVDQVVGSFVVAVDTASGEPRWRRDRPRRIESYSTPILFPNGGDPELVLVLGSGWIDAYDVHSGEPRWSLDGVGVGPVASPVLAEDLLVVTAPDHAAEPMPPFDQVLAERDADGNGSLEPTDVRETWMADHFGFLDIDADGRIGRLDWETLGGEMASDSWGVYGLRFSATGGPPEPIWNLRRAVPYIPTPLIYDDRVLLVKDSILTCLDSASGELVSRQRLGGGQSQVYASPVAGGDRALVATVDGTLVVVAAGGACEILERHDLGSEIYATPAIADDQLYVRTRDRLLRFSSPRSAAVP